jgi:hypothetical protein
VAVATALLVCASAAGDGIALLNLRVAQGEGMVYATGSRATRGIAVEITDELARPVPGVSVSFLLPDSGPSGTFPSGGRNEIVVTGQDGRAAVWGMRWGRTPGRVDIRITAALGGVRAGTVVSQTLAPRAREASMGPGSAKKILLIAGIVAAAAGAGAALGSRGSNSSVAAPPVAPPAIGGPTITIGR